MGGSLDVAFYIDNSNDAVSLVQWLKILQFMSTFMSGVKVGSPGVKLAVVDASGIRFDLNKYTTKTQVSFSVFSRLT
jgi:von Willebrand factor type A domain